MPEYTDTSIPSAESATPSALVDLASLDTTAISESGQDLHVEHPVSGESLGIVITLAGSDSAAYRKAMELAGKRRVKKNVMKLTATDLINETVDILAACTLRWSGLVLDGAEIPCTPENARKVYTRFAWLREQADRFTQDRGNYLRD